MDKQLLEQACILTDCVLANAGLWERVNGGYIGRRFVDLYLNSERMVTDRVCQSVRFTLQAHEVYSAPGKIAVCWR